MPSATHKTYTTISRGRGAAIFQEGEEWTVRGFPAGSTPVEVTFRTAYEDRSFEANLPRWLFAEVTGYADSLEDAIRRFPNAASALTPVFDVALNTSVDDLVLHVGFDATPDCAERKFFQNFVPDDPPTLRQTRPVHRGLLSCLVESMARHPDHVRLHRAAAHYQQALRFWSYGDETRAVGQLWMGMEALTPVAKRDQLEKTGARTAAELADALKVELKHLDATLRRTVLFVGDEYCYKTVADVSNGFEHGYLPLDQLRQLSRDVREAAAAWLRKAIVNLSRVPEPTRSEMLGAPFDTPIIGFPVTKYLRGTLIGSGDPAAPGARYPVVTWRTDIKSFRKENDGRHNVQWNESITPRLGPHVQLTGVSIELWSGDKNTGTTATMQRAVVERAGSTYEVSRDRLAGGAADEPPEGRSALE